MNGTSIAQVTAALKGVLKANLDSKVSITMLQPSDALPEKCVNLYLYRVCEIVQLRNMDWQGSRSLPAADIAALPLELYYLLTPWDKPPDSDEAILPQTHGLLGQAMRVLHEHCILNDVHTKGFDFDSFQGIDDLRDAYDQITIRLHPVSVDEMSKVWSMFNQPYRLSVVYQISLVQIAPTCPARRVAPVMVTGLDVLTTDPPRLAALDPPRGGTGGKLILRGFGLARTSLTTVARFGGQPVEISGGSEWEIGITVPIGLEAGPEQEVRVALGGQLSQPLTYLVSPWLRRLQPLRGAVGGTPVKVTLEVEGSDLGTAASVQVTIDGALQPGTALDSSHLQITVPDTLPNGLHRVQISVDGQASNARDFEVVPLLTSLEPAVPIVGNAILINGKRLKGDSVRVNFGGATVEIGRNTDANRVQVLRVPRLGPGKYEVRVSVDGSESNSIPFNIV